MRIAVCDDDIGDRKKITGHVRMYLERHGMEAQVEEFADGAALLRRTARDPFAIIFLDIFLERENGVEVAQELRRSGEEGCILIFCTVSPDFALEGFAVNARHYLVKPVVYPHVATAMDRCGDRLRQSARTLELSAKLKSRVRIQDILFVEAMNKICYIHLAGSAEATRKTISQLERELSGESFLRCHRSFIVNMEYVESYSQTDFLLRNGMRVPIRQTGRNRIKQTYRQYMAARVAQTV